MSAKHETLIDLRTGIILENQRIINENQSAIRRCVITLAIINVISFITIIGLIIIHN